MALSVIPNDPAQLRPGRNNQAIYHAKNEWLTYYLKEGVFDSLDIEDALLEPFDYQRLAAPRLAPHFSRKMKSDPRNNVKTNLDLNMQTDIEKLASTYSKRLKIYGINNISVIVV